MHVNMGGLYRHLNTLEQRGMLVSEWHTDTGGPARRSYTLTETGNACLLRWIQTIQTQAALIEVFLDQANRVFPDQQLPMGGSTPPLTCC